MKGNTSVLLFFRLSFIIIIFSCYAVYSNSASADGDMMKITYRDGSTQYVRLDHESRDIVRVEYGSFDSEEPEGHELVRTLTASEKREIVQQYTGAWQSEFGVVNFNAVGMRLYGKFDNNRGQITMQAAPDGTSLTGTWSHRPEKPGGAMVLELSDDGRLIRGKRWNEGDDENDEPESFIMTKIE